jgi:dipeptidyl aminopeptidase/acylaminoacyl peptidase
VQQSVELAQKIRAVCGDERVTLEVFEGFGHGDQRFDSPVNVKRVLDFIDQHLKTS